MSELVFNAVFQDISLKFRDETFSTMYSGRHCGKNILILNYDLTLMVVFGDVLQWSTPELVKAISFRGERRKGVQIVGNENVILLLDEQGSLWKLINAFEVLDTEKECFHSLKEECFYEWVPFKKFRLKKVLAISAFEQGFTCLGVCGNFKKKILGLASNDSILEEYTFEELNTPESNLCNYYLTNLKIKSSVFENAVTPSTTETLLVSDRISGKTYLCTKNRRSLVINISNNFLISALHLQQEKCLLLCFENGKLIFCFYNESYRQSVAYLSKKLVFVVKCCCPDMCVLWSDGNSLNHTKFTFKCGVIKSSHLKLSCSVQSPLSVVKINQHFLVVTINNFYYAISAGVKCAAEISKQTHELLSEICKGSNLIEELEKKIDLLVHYLQCKEIVQKCNTKGKTEIKQEGKCLVIKSSLGVSLREEFWKVHLMSSMCHKKSVHVTDLEGDLSKEALIVIENPFRSKSTVKIRLIGNFDRKELFLDLGETGESESNFEKDHMDKQIQKILRNRQCKLHRKGT